jgi:tRNA U55 pseudouridine synthase TruB
VGAYLHALRRVRSGSVSAAECAPLERLGDREGVVGALLPADRAVIGWPAAVLTDAAARAICMGQSVPDPGAHRGRLRVYDPRGRLIALADGGEEIRPFRVFEGGTNAAGQ